jgi:hypothetical protein
MLQTVIFDSCHSGSSTRDSTDLGGEIRSIDLPFEYRVRCEDPYSSRAIGVAKRFDNAGLSSHVLLAAASSSYSACEHQGRGVFTKALLDLLRRVPLGSLTYLEVMNQLPDLSK